MTHAAELQLVVRRVIKASPERLFKAWTTPWEFIAWWGPKGVRCTHAEMDLSVGGRYRIGNEDAHGRVVFIVGEFLSIDPPRQLAYTWSIEPENAPVELVTVHFNAGETGTEVVITHEKIRSERIRQEHSQGWEGCLDGLVAHAGN